MAEAIEIDVAFLLDGTQSMDKHRLAALNNCEEVAHVITQRYPLAKIRFALVVYRDFLGDDGWPMGDDQFEVLDFGTVEALYARLERTKTFGGYDFAEDVDGGLKKLLSLSWRSSSAVTKVAVWIADAPAHGKRFNDLDETNDKHMGEEIGDPIESVRRLRWQRIQLCFFRITEHTDKMLDVLSLNYNRAGSNKKLKLRTYDLGSDPTRKFLMHTINSITTSVSVTLDSSHDGQPSLLDTFRTKPAFLLGPLIEEDEEGENAVDEFGLPVVATPSTIDRQFSSQDEVVEVYTAEEDGGRGGREPVGRKHVALGKPFARGSSRAAIWCLDKATREVRVVKEPMKNTARHASKEALFADLDSQARARDLAVKFTGACRLELGSKGPKFEVVPACVYRFIKRSDPSRQWCMCEPALSGTFRKFNSNAGFAEASPDAEPAQAFSHWCFQSTGGEYMVTDVQGVLSDQNTFTLTDPQIHSTCEPGRFGTGNLARDGMMRFFMNHQCGPTCRALGLRPPDKLPAAVTRNPIAVPEAEVIFVDPVPARPDVPMTPVPQDRAPEWIKDFDVFKCQSCGRNFNYWWCWRHHCRVCGNVFCDACSRGRVPSETIPFPALRPGASPPAPGEQLRACKGCIHRMTNWVGTGVRTMPVPSAPPKPT